MLYLQESFLLNIEFFIDELKLDKFGRRGVEVILGCFMSFKREKKNTGKEWILLGLLKDLHLYNSSKDYGKAIKMQDYHDMISYVFKE